MIEIEDRLRALETWKASVDISHATSSVQWEYMVKRFDAIDSRLDKYDAHIGKFLWLIVAVVAGAFATFVIKGGLV